MFDVFAIEIIKISNMILKYEGLSRGIIDGRYLGSGTILLENGTRYIGEIKVEKYHGIGKENE